MKNYTKNTSKIARICAFCGKIFYRWPSQYNEGRGKFCSKLCKAKSESHPKTPFPSKIIRHKYFALRMPSHPRSNTNGYVFEHILIAEKKIGRKLKQGEVVHHIDGNRLNNDPNNLLAMMLGEHFRYHNTKWQIPESEKIEYMKLLAVYQQRII